MGTKLFDFLDNTILFDDAALASEFEAVDDPRLRDELSRYREFVDGNLDDLRGEIDSASGGLKLLADGGRISLDLLSRLLKN